MAIAPVSNPNALTIGQAAEQRALFHDTALRIYRIARVETPRR